MSRISDSDKLEVTLAKIAGGTQGAISALADIVEKGPRIDPEMESAGIGHILLLDNWEIYGSEIYILLEDKCHGNVRRLLLLLRATQLGKFTKSRLKELANDQCRKESLSKEVWEELDYLVCQALPNFEKIGTDTGYVS